VCLASDGALESLRATDFHRRMRGLGGRDGSGLTVSGRLTILPRHQDCASEPAFAVHVGLRRFAPLADDRRLRHRIENSGTRSVSSAHQGLASSTSAGWPG
jgi:hypothetical protein